MIVAQAKVEGFVNTLIDVERTAQADSLGGDPKSDPDVLANGVDPFEDAFLPEDIEPGTTDDGPNQRSRQNTPNDETEVERYVKLAMVARSANPLSWWREPSAPGKFGEEISSNTCV